MGKAKPSYLIDRCLLAVEQVTKDTGRSGRLHWSVSWSALDVLKTLPEFIVLPMVIGGSIYMLIGYPIRIIDDMPPRLIELSDIDNSISYTFELG